MACFGNSRLLFACALPVLPRPLSVTVNGHVRWLVTAWRPAHRCGPFVTSWWPNVRMSGLQHFSTTSFSLMSPLTTLASQTQPITSSATFSAVDTSSCSILSVHPCANSALPYRTLAFYIITPNEKADVAVSTHHRFLTGKRHFLYDFLS